MSCKNCNLTLTQLSSCEYSIECSALSRFLPLIKLVETQFKTYIIDCSTNNLDLSGNPLDTDNKPFSRNLLDISLAIVDVSYNLYNNLAYLYKNGHINEQLYRNTNSYIYEPPLTYIRKCINTPTLLDNGSSSNTITYQECVFDNNYRIYNNYKNYSNTLSIDSNSPVNSLWISYNNKNFIDLDCYGNNSIIVNLSIDSEGNINYIYFYENRLENFS